MCATHNNIVFYNNALEKRSLLLPLCRGLHDSHSLCKSEQSYATWNRPKELLRSVIARDAPVPNQSKIYMKTS